MATYYLKCTDAAVEISVRFSFTQKTAYEILSDEEKRKQYDKYGEKAFENAGAGAGGFGDFNFNFEDFFKGFDEAFSGFGGMYNYLELQTHYTSQFQLENFNVLEICS